MVCELIHDWTFKKGRYRILCLPGFLLVKLGRREYAVQPQPPQTEIHEKLNAVGIETIPLELRHDRIISGGFHCATLDLKRKRAS